MKFEKLFAAWRMNELRCNMPGDSRNPLWEKLAAGDEIAAWLFIEENYLQKYNMLIRIEPE